MQGILAVLHKIVHAASPLSNESVFQPAVSPRWSLQAQRREGAEMRSIKCRWVCFVVTAAGAALNIRTADASLLSLGNVIAATGQHIPGQSAGVTWGALNTPSVAANGTVAFSGAINGVVAVNNLGIFSGTSSSNVAVAVQSGTQAPGGTSWANIDIN
jgi:hypothetical protein